MFYQNFLRDSIWPTNKILPDKWTHWVNDNHSLSQKVIAKVTFPQGISPQEDWERMLVGMANEQFCALHSNIKQTLFLQYEGSICLTGFTVHVKCFVLCIKSILANHMHLVCTCMTSTADKKIKQ